MTGDENLPNTLISKEMKYHSYYTHYQICCIVWYITINVCLSIWLLFIDQPFYHERCAAYLTFPLKKIFFD